MKLTVRGERLADVGRGVVLAIAISMVVLFVYWIVWQTLSLLDTSNLAYQHLSNAQFAAKLAADHAMDKEAARQIAIGLTGLILGYSNRKPISILIHAIKVRIGLSER